MKQKKGKTKMYINETHIIYYVVAAILGLFVGMFLKNFLMNIWENSDQIIS